MNALLAHILGDYFLQSSWMAMNKTKKTWICAIHVLIYTACFAFFMALGLLSWSWKALAVIGGTHFVIDRLYLARYVGYAKNFLAPASWRFPWSRCRLTGYNMDGWPLDEKATAPFVAVWLMIITDNAMHIAINHFALSCL